MSEIEDAEAYRLRERVNHESTMGLLKGVAEERDALREGLDAAIRCAKLALFVIRKQGVMPNSSWESGFNADLAKAEAARAISTKAPLEDTQR